MDKKGQGFVMNVIIIAAIALVVLLVLVAIFTGKIGSFVEASDKGAESARGSICTSEPGAGCLASDLCADKRTSEPIQGWTDCSSSQVCCTKRK